jgi:hypothetical protein
VGVHAQLCPYDKEFFALFVDSTLVEGEAALRRDPSLRNAFVEYIKGGRWMERLTKFECDILKGAESEDTPTWTKFGYDCPADSLRARSGSVCSNATQLTSGSSRKSEHPVVSKEARAARVTLHECYSAMGGWTLFLEKEELRGILFAALYPLYLQSSEYKMWRNPSGWRASLEASSSDSAESVSFSSQYPSLKQSRKARKSQRLRELLVGTAALFDGTELESYLADPCVSWIEDFKMAVTNLPLNIMICRVNREHNEARVVYSNIKRTSNPTAIPEDEEVPGEPANEPTSTLHSVRASFALPTSARVVASIKESSPFSTKGSTKSARVGSSSVDFSDKVGKNLVDLHSNGHTVDSIKQLQRAVFGAQHFKQRFVRSNGDFHLRALKPVFSTQGRHLCTISIDAYGTADHSTVPDMQYPPETRFQEVEDVLALLPLFIKG